MPGRWRRASYLEELAKPRKVEVPIYWGDNPADRDAPGAVRGWRGQGAWHNHTTRFRRQLIMSMLDIAMAAGVVVLVVLIILRKKNKG